MARRVGSRHASSDTARPVSDQESLEHHAAELASRGAPFDRLLAQNGIPPLWRRPPTFATLVRLILEQQVSLSSAAAAYSRLHDRVGSVTPATVLESTDEQLRMDGLSRQKSRYVRSAASRIEEGGFRLPVPGSGREDALGALRSLTGVGPWTAACYLIFACGDPDVWPTGDRALQVSVTRVLGLDSVPTTDVVDEIASPWSPHRSTAARMLWHDYLGGASYRALPNAGFA
jgi:DNA-3-methyladenine glycosylase II